MSETTFRWYWKLDMIGNAKYKTHLKLYRFLYAWNSTAFAWAMTSLTEKMLVDFERYLN